jgi:hypothetical protein
VSRGSTWTDLGQHKYKNYYCHSCKTWFNGQPIARPKSWIDRVNIRIKNYYYNNFKTRLRSWSKTTFRLWVGRVNLFNPKFFKKIIKATLIFWSIFLKKKKVNRFLTWILSWVDLVILLSQVEFFLFFYFFLNSGHLKSRVDLISGQPTRLVLVL